MASASKHQINSTATTAMSPGRHWPMYPQTRILLWTIGSPNSSQYRSLTLASFHDFHISTAKSNTIDNCRAKQNNQETETLSHSKRLPCGCFDFPPYVSSICTKSDTRMLKSNCYFTETLIGPRANQSWSSFVPTPRTLIKVRSSPNPSPHH